MTKEEIRKILSGISIFTLLAGSGLSVSCTATASERPAQTG